MDITIDSTKEAPLLSRKEVMATATFSGATPSRLDIIKAAAKKIGVDEKLVLPVKIETLFGSEQAVVELHVYNSEESMNQVEGEHMVKRLPVEKKKEESKEVAKPVASAPVEKKKEEPVVEKKEEPATEEKPKSSEEVKGNKKKEGDN